ncbi:MAG: phosphoglycerate dehydrogenase [Desulfobacterota bacterium]|nr:phosphoglycerate dehydrogenase [Thermodesulfobacteriota bacterium]MDW8002210.1 phosphoglycerate dehydrogenase [Deltaproteobacteria bacterium]
MVKVLIADDLSEKALEILKENNFEFDIKTGLKGEELRAIIGNYDALIVRSATKVTKDVIEKADKLKIIGRAGIGVDNVDVAAATEKGIIVMNTPQGNALAAAEHTIGLIFAAARKIAQADRTMKEGKWEKKKLMGIEIYGKTLGIIGIGNIGSLVAEKALGLGMRVIAYDPYVSREYAEAKKVELVDFETLLRESDIITIHVPLSKETKNMINKEAIEKMKDGVILVNVARGSIVNEKDLLDALNSGKVSYAALDVFEVEPPPPSDPLVLSEKTVCTPHLGASTVEAQDKVAIDIANQIVEYFKYGVIKNSVNAPSVSMETAKEIAPYLALSENLACLLGSITEFPIKEISIDYIGEVSRLETRVLTQGILKNILSPQIEGVNYVNAPLVAKSRNIKVIESKIGEHHDYVSLVVITVKENGRSNSVEGTLLGKKEPRLIKVNNIYVEADIKGGTFLFVYNYDRPGVIASISSVFHKKGINIGSMHFGRESKGGVAISLLGLDEEIDDTIIKEIEALPNILKVKKIEFPVRKLR